MATLSVIILLPFFLPCAFSLILKSKHSVLIFLIFSLLTVDYSTALNRPACGACGSHRAIKLFTEISILHFERFYLHFSDDNMVSGLSFLAQIFTMPCERTPKWSSVGSNEYLQMETCSALLKQRFQRQRTPSEILQDVNRDKQVLTVPPSKKLHKLTNISNYGVEYYLE